MLCTKTLAFTSLAALSLSACVLIGVEPEVIGEGEGSETSGNNDTDNSAEGDGDGDNDGSGDGDGDGGGDGDGDTGGDGDGDTGTETGDGDGDDSAETGDGDGDGDGDTGGDGDGDSGGPDPCDTLEALGLDVGSNPIDVPNVMSLYDLSCGTPGGPDVLLSFTAPADATYQISVDSTDFTAVIGEVGPLCVPLDEISCASADGMLESALTAGDVIYLVLDSDQDPGMATVTITQL